MEEITELEWQILDSLADDKECIVTMDIRDFALASVRETVYKLYSQGLIHATPEPVELETLMNEPSDYKDAHYWFGLTSSGVEYWEEGAKKYSDGPIDWSKAWSGNLSYKKQEGYVDGISKEVCMDALQKWVRDEDWQIALNTLIHSEIKGFQAKYYKYISGGHRITFKLNKKTTP